jgi:hypothetical protein
MMNLIPKQEHARMNYRTLTIALVAALVSVAQAQPTKVTITGDNTEINGKKIFGISVAVLPPPDGKDAGR